MNISPAIIRRFSVIALAILVPFFARPVFPAEPLKPETDRSTRITARHMDILPDPDRKLSFAMISSPAMSNRFAPSATDQIVIPEAAQACWIRFRLSPGDKPAGSYPGLLELNCFTIGLNRVDLYVPGFDPHGKPAYTVTSTGAMVPRRPGDIRSRYYVFELPPSARDGRFHYLRLENGRQMVISLYLRPPLLFHRSEVVYYSVFGIIYGILLSMVLYNFFIFITLKDRTYLYYILYILSGILWQFWTLGHSKMFLGQVPGWDFALGWVFVGFMLLWGAIFSIRFLSVKKNLPVLSMAFILLAITGVMTIIAGFFKLHMTALYLSHTCGLILPFLVITVAGLRLRQGFKPARYYIFAWLSLAAGGFLFTLMSLDVLPMSFWTVNGLSVGMTAEAILLSLSLADRIRVLREEKEYYQKTQQRYLELSITDALTGLHNKRYLLSKLTSEVDHALRLGQPLSLFLIDIDDFKKFNDRYGHTVGDMVLERLARTMKASIRDGDIACRFGGEEFVIILPGLKSSNAFNVAERIRLAFSRESIITKEENTFSASISVGVAELTPTENADTLLDRADRAMYEAKRLGKNRTVVN